MKPQNINQEILLFTGTSFSKKDFCEKNPEHGNRTASPIEQLQMACWSGMLFEMLPEILDRPLQKQEKFIWEVMPAHNFIRICLGPSPAIPESETCIDPYFFLPTIKFN